MSWADRVVEAYGGGVDASADPVTVDVAAGEWVAGVALARDELGCRFFDWLSAVDEGDGLRLVCHLAGHRTGEVDHLLVRTLLPHEGALVASVAGVFAGARWHERETHEMFGVDFTDGGEVLPLERLLLPDAFEGHPLRKDFVLAARVVRPWPGSLEPGEDSTSSPSRRRTLPPGVPDPLTWGPRKGPRKEEK
jgi:NADH:ubiquinone oxidoreductase subunit C